MGCRILKFAVPVVISLYIACILIAVGIIIHKEYILWRLGYRGDVEILEVGNPKWKSEVEHIRDRVLRLVEVSKELGIFDENVYPISIMIADVYEGWASADSGTGEIKITPNFLVAVNAFIYTKDDIDGLLAHEFSHLLVGSRFLHSQTWRKTCVTLALKLNCTGRAGDWCRAIAPH